MAKKYIKCPRCELNYILEGEDYCHVCKSEMKHHTEADDELIDLEDMDYISWRSTLVKDRDTLHLLILMMNDISPEHDSKLQELFAVLKNKIENAVEAGEEVNIPKFGKFKKKLRAARVGRDMTTGCMVPIPERYMPVFEPAKHFKDKVSEVEKK